MRNEAVPVVPVVSVVWEGAGVIELEVCIGMGWLGSWGSVALRAGAWTGPSRRPGRTKALLCTVFLNETSTSAGQTMTASA
ncbi:hypothetical protein GCM10017608_17370 [Agromyces luteolus]|nr:hypothetical protein GCM10017608_17370 [Agromyces luteolus]